jgi:hypothetical protein
LYFKGNTILLLSDRIFVFLIVIYLAMISKTIAIFLTIGIALTAFMAPIMMANEADARITCQNPGGQEPQGNCQGANQNVNPTGKAPPGQN